MEQGQLVIRKWWMPGIAASGGGRQSLISPVSTNFDSTDEKISQNSQLVIKY